MMVGLAVIMPRCYCVQTQKSTIILVVVTTNMVLDIMRRNAVSCQAMDKRWGTVKSAAKLMGVKERWVQTLLQSGDKRLRYERWGREYLVFLPSARAFKSKRKNGKAIS